LDIISIEGTVVSEIKISYKDMITFKGGTKRTILLNICMVLLMMENFCLADLSVKQIFEQNCAVCHQLENAKEPIVGPSLVEITHLYKGDLDGFLKWCNEPGKKRKDAIDMPSMAHVGNANLTAIHAWILEATKGKKFNPNKLRSGDLYGLDFSKLDRPIMQRIFMADSSPASIAVSIDGKHSLCWDTVSCRMRYVWHGGYIDGFPYWQGNGNAFANVIGEIYYRAPKDIKTGLMIEGAKDLPKFKGYQLVNGLPVFSYSIGSIKVSEAIQNKNGNLVIQIKMDSNNKAVSYPLGDLVKTEFSYSAGKVENETLVLTANEAAEFEITINIKK
jgi:cytochrome c551/c552